MYSSEEKRSLSFGMGGEDKFFVSSSSSKDGDDEFAFPERDSDEENLDEEKEEGEKTRVMKTRFSKELRSENKRRARETNKTTSDDYSPTR